MLLLLLRCFETARALTPQPKRVPPPRPFRPQLRFRELASSKADAAAARGQQEFHTLGAAGGSQKDGGEGEGLLRDSMVCPVFAALPQEQQLEAFEPAPAGTRKFVLASLFVAVFFVWLSVDVCFSDY